MQKIPTMFQRNMGPGENHQVRDDVTPGCEWVLAGEGVATRKFDGQAALVQNGQLYKRYDARGADTDKLRLMGWFPAQEEPDIETGHWPGWLPVGQGPEDQYFRLAYYAQIPLDDGTYELVGPKVQGNPEDYTHPALVRHGSVKLRPDFPRDFEGIKAALSGGHIEGVVFHHQDGRMAKIKTRDFGLKRTSTTTPER